MSYQLFAAGLANKKYVDLLELPIFHINFNSNKLYLDGFPLSENSSLSLLVVLVSGIHMWLPQMVWMSISSQIYKSFRKL